MNKVLQTISSRGLSDRVAIYIALLMMVANVPNMMAWYYQQDWTFFAINVVVIVIAIVTAYLIYKNVYVSVMQFILAFMISAGMIAICVEGNSAKLYWLFPGVISVFFLLRPSVALTFSAIITATIFPYLSKMDNEHSLSFYAAMLPTIFFVYFCAKELRKQHTNLSTLATEDFLTKTGNRRAFQQDADISIANFNRHNVACSLILLDMDRFKLLNDTYGHTTGDEVLKFTSRIIDKRLRRTDRLYRLGGEEFAILLNHGGVKEALSAAQDLKTFIAKNMDENLPAFTISFGVAQLKNGETLDAWMTRADKALYASKENGRDQITTAH
jgi:diguanylate cyclase (GGDEF)-like protein